MRALRTHLTYANVIATLALVIAVGGGAAYAANTVFSTDIVDGQVYSADVRNDTLAGGGLTAADLRSGSVGTAEVGDNQVRSADVRDDSLSGGGLTAADLGPNAAGLSELNPAAFQDDDISPTGLFKRFEIAIDAIQGNEVENEALTGADIQDQSGVDTCTHGTVRFHELCVGVANISQNWWAALDLCAGQELRLPSLGEALALARKHDLPNVDQTEDFWTDERSVTQEPSSKDIKVWGEVVDDAAVWTSSDLSVARETVCVTTPTN